MPWGGSMFKANREWGAKCLLSGKSNCFLLKCLILKKISSSKRHEIARGLVVGTWEGLSKGLLSGVQRSSSL